MKASTSFLDERVAFGPASLDDKLRLAEESLRCANAELRFVGHYSIPRNVQNEVRRIERSIDRLWAYRARILTAHRDSKKLLPPLTRKALDAEGSLRDLHAEKLAAGVALEASRLAKQAKWIRCTSCNGQGDNGHGANCPACGGRRWVKEGAKHPGSKAQLSIEQKIAKLRSSLGLDDPRFAASFAAKGLDIETMLRTLVASPSKP